MAEPPPATDATAAPRPDRTPAAAAPAASAAPGDTDTGARPTVPSFGARDPDARAQRLARALVSDIVAYHPDRVERALSSGALRSEFRDEIMKSWEEYVAQVGAERAKGTPFFREALNEILAQGQKVF